MKIVMEEESTDTLLFPRLPQSLTKCAPGQKWPKIDKNSLTLHFSSMDIFRRSSHNHKGKIKNVPMPCIQLVLRKILVDLISNMIQDPGLYQSPHH